MCNNWVEARNMYSWKVDLNTFQDANRYPGHFHLIVTPDQTPGFENRFRSAVEKIANGDNHLFAAEVNYWKNFGNHMARNRLTKSIIDHLYKETKWQTFCHCVIQLAKEPSLSKFKELQKACGQPKGFATPLTFLSFYDPVHFPMVDRRIGLWWKTHKEYHRHLYSTAFSQRRDGWIQTTTIKNQEQNWDAYCAWTKFCRDTGRKLTRQTGSPWRARDVEIAVWEAQKRNIALESLT